jgi:LPXTG-site transpeptidase (sortase) family protein
VEVTDSLPAGLTLVSATPSTGAYNSGTGLWNIGALANGTNATLSIVATVNTTVATTNAAGKTAEDQPDAVAANNSASASVNAIAADVAITKTVSNTVPNQNTDVTFTITATNNGPSNSTGVQVTDLLPAGLAFVSSVQSAGAYNSATGLWDIGVLANGSNATLSITATVTGTTAVTNIATKAAEVQSDPVAGNDSASVTVTGQAADIAITKTVSNLTPSFGTSVTFTVTATNTGPSNATGVEVTDSLPAGLTFVSAAPSGTTTYNSGTGVWTIGPLANSASATLSIVATVSTTAVTTNTATRTAENQPDPGAGNDSATATITPVAADIAITKTVSNTTPNQNTNVTFTVTATNNGPSNATGVVVTDLLPAGLTFVSAAPSVGTSYNQVNGVWTIGALGNGGNATLSIVATVTGTTAVTNTATRSAGSQPDPVAGNNSASATVSGQGADIAIVKTVSSPSVPLGSNVTFVVTATNNGPSDATGAQVTDSLPAGLTLVSATPSGATTYNSGTGVWNIGALANGAQATLSIVAQVTVTTPATNTATKTAEDQADAVPGNDSASATVTGASADISVTKTVNHSTPKFGQNVTYTLVAHNLGPSTATGVRLHDVLPTGVTFVSYTATQGTYNPATGIWNVGTMVNGRTVSLSVVVKVTSSGAIVNTVTTLAGGYFDPNLSNNVSSAAMLAGLPGLPNTSSPYGTSGGPGPTAGQQQITGLLIAILAAVAGLGVVALAGIGRRRRARFGERRSRSGQRQGSGRLAIGLLAVLLSLAVASISVGGLGSYALPTVAGLAPGTQMIGSKVVSMKAPVAPKGKSFHQVAGPITPSRIRIPSIGVDAWIGAVGLLSDGSMDVPDNLWTSSWLDTGPRPGQAGNAVIAGHRGVGTPALFSHLEKVQPGDRIYVSDAAGNELIYVVTRVASLDLSVSTQVAVFEPTTSQQLVLITCFGRFMDTTRTYDHRLVVFSRPLPLAS